jgi:hypothetical protein
MTEKSPKPSHNSPEYQTQLPVSGQLELFLREPDFRKAYGYNRAYFHLYGDREPTHFVGEFPHPAETLALKTVPKPDKKTKSRQLSSIDEQREFLVHHIHEGNRIVSNVIPFTITENRREYTFFFGHESNEVIEQTDGLCRGFLMSLKGPWMGTEIIQLDPASNRALFDRDKTLGKHHFFSVFMNLLLNGYSSPLVGHNATSQGGIFTSKYLAVVNEEFAVERMISIADKRFFRNMLTKSDSTVKTNSMPWIVELDVIK